MCIVLSKYLQTGLYNYNLPYCVAIYSQTKASTLTFTRKVPKYIIHFWRYLSVKVCTGVFFSKGSLAGVLILGGGCIVSHHIGGFYLRVRGGVLKEETRCAVLYYQDLPNCGFGQNYSFFTQFLLIINLK